jgi:Resolvase, N terminal domain
MINFCAPSPPVTAWRALKNVLQSRRVYQSSGRRFSYSPGVTAPHRDTSEAHGSLLAPEPAVRTGALIGYARVSTSGQLLDRQQHALAEAGCLRVFADKLSGKDADRPELAACLDYLRPGDTLVVPSLDRLSRSLADLIGIVTTLRRQGIGFKSLHEAWTPPPPAAGWSSTSSPRWPSSSAS